MAYSEVLLLKPVDGLGGEGDQVKVRAGYARNFLLLQGFAVPLTRANKKQVEALKKRRGEREAQELVGAQELGKKIETTSLVFVVKTGDGGKMFGAITVNDLHAKLAASGVELDKRKIQLHTPIKTIGKHTVKVKLHADVSVELPFDVVSENPIVAAVVEAPAEAPRKERKERKPREPQEAKDAKGATEPKE